MSLRTRINCYTAWANFRLLEHEKVMNNIIIDLLAGRNLKFLAQSMLGFPPKRLDNLDTLTQSQISTRVEWVIKELRANNLLSSKKEIDGRMFAMKSADEIFGLCWMLVTQDIYFLWDRQEYLRLKDYRKLCEVPMKWVPDQIPDRSVKKSAVEIDEDDAMMMGFGNTAASQQTFQVEAVPDDFQRYSNQDKCLEYKPMSKRMKKRPPPEKCMLEIIQAQMNLTEEGKAMGIKSLRDMTKSTAFCALMNTFVPDTFSNEILLSDRWSFNLAISIFEKMTHLETPMSSEDFLNFEQQPICAFFCAFFMLMFKMKQCQAAVKRFGEVKITIRRAEMEIAKAEEDITAASNDAAKQWRGILEGTQIEKLHLKNMYDIEWCENWVKHVAAVQKQTRHLIRNKMKTRFETILVPQNMTVSELVDSLGINLSLTRCNGLSKLTDKELIPTDKKVVARVTKTGEFLDDFSGASKSSFSIRKFLGYSTSIMSEMKPEKHPKYDLFVEVGSMSKLLKAGSEYIYLVFPGGMGIYENMLQKAVKNGELEMVRKFVVFFNSRSFVNCVDPTTGNTPLHWASKHGYDTMALFLLENGAQCNAVNFTQSTPFSYAMSSIHKNCAQLLIEWGCDTWYKDHTGKSAWDIVRNEGMKKILFEWYEYLSESVPKIVKGETPVLLQMIENHVNKTHPFTSLRSRSIQGSTLLHTACHFAHKESVELLLSERVDVNVRDYKGATPLHRVKSVECMTILMDAGADVFIQDDEGNTPLHVLCYEGCSSREENEGLICVLTKKGSDILARNNKNLMPIHCAAMGGNIDTVLILLEKDQEGITNSLRDEPQDGLPPSLLFLALNDFHLDCARQLLDVGIHFKEGEAKNLLHKYLTGVNRSDLLVDMITFLLDNGASLHDRFETNEVTALHLVSANVLFTDLIDLMISDYDADVDVQDKDGLSPLFHACKNNNPFGASLLLEHGANMRLTNQNNVMPFDMIGDFDDWIDSGFFSKEMVARLKAYSLKQSRELIRTISKKVSGPSINSKSRLMFGETNFLKN